MRQPSLLGSAVGLIGFSVVAGLLVSATITPAVAVASSTANSSLDIFENLPEFAQIDEQSEVSTIYGTLDGASVPIAEFYSQNREVVTLSQAGQWAPLVHAIPANPRARAIQLVGEQFLHVNVGDHGGQFELSYSLEDEELAIRLIDAVVAGRVSESVGFTGTTTHVELDSGSVTSETAIAVWKRRNGAWRHSYEPY